MTRSFGLLGSLILFAISTAMAQAVDDRSVAAPMGIGLGGVASYGESWQFTNMMRHSREWLARKDQKAWTIVEDAHGWPVSLKHTDGTTAEISPENPVFMYFYGRHVQGLVTLTWEGDGEVAVGGKGYPLVEDKFPAEKCRVYQWDYTAGSPTIEVIRSNPQNNVKNIRVWMPGFADGKTTFHPVWTKILEPFPYFRFMDWGSTNNSTQAEWKDRPVPEDMRYTNGVPYELMIQLCNEMKKDAWICVPHLASDDYVRQLAKLLKAQLDPKLRVYIEYSNEIWNPSFQQTKYLYKQAKAEIEAKGLTDSTGKPMKEWEYASDLCGRRSAQIWKIMAQELGDPDRLVRTLTHFRWMDRAIAAALDPANGDARLDLIGLNGYFISQHSLNYAKRELGNWDPAEAFDVLEQLHLIETVGDWNTSIGDARTRWPKIPVTCYEGGQHFANPFASDLQGAGLVERMFEINGDPRIKKIYRTALETWHLAGAEGFTAFVDCGTWGKYGCWGHKQYAAQPLEDRLDAGGKVVERGAHKYAALLEYIERRSGQIPGKAPIIETTALPDALLEKSYDARLTARAGTPPYKWSLLGGRLPDGLSVKPDGTISGMPTKAEQLAFLVDCTDSKGQHAAAQLGLFMSPVRESAWKQINLAELLPIHDIPSLPESASAKGYSVEVTLTPKVNLSQHARPGIAVNLTPDGDKEDFLRIAIQGQGKEVQAYSRYVAGGKDELWRPRTAAIIPDEGESAEDQTWDAGEAWTLSVTVRPASGKDAIDLVIGLRDENGRERLAPAYNVAQGRLLLREVEVKEALRSGPFGIMARDVDVTNLRWAPIE